MSLRGFALRHPLVVEIVGQRSLFIKQLELPQTPGDLLLGELGFRGR